MASESQAIRFEACSLHRRGHAPEEYEDAFAADAARGRFAVADGASESAFAGRWAQLLVEAFVNAPAESASWTAWLPAAQKRWTTEVGGRALSWYAETKFQEGAFAAFLGLVVGPRHWNAVAVGDSCLFQVRQDRLHQSFPLAAAGDFGNTPWLVGSRDAAAASLAKKEVRAKGDCLPGDHLWLMTDALAQWFLQRVETVAQPWRELEGVLAAPARVEAFAAWVHERWDTRHLRNDDVTLVEILL